MGSRMAAVLLSAGHRLTVWNRTSEKTQALENAGATVAETPKQATKNADIVISMVRDDAASEAVWLDAEVGALAGIKAGTIAIESSTLTPTWVKTLAQQCRVQGVSFLDAPVAGTRPQAEAAKLIYFVGGDTTAFAVAKPILEVLGGSIHHAGPNGSGAALKLAVNALFGVQLATLAELIGLLQHSNLDLEHAMDIITSTPVCSPAAKQAAGAMVAEAFAPMFPIDLVEKDFGYVETTAKQQGAAVPVSAHVRQVLQDAIAQGYEGDNITALIKLYR